MIGNEWLNIQDIFGLFLGRWIVIYVAAAFSVSGAMSIIGLLWRRVPHVRIVGWKDE